MPKEGIKRKISAILSADVVGYSKLMEADEETTVRTIESYRKTISSLIEQHDGRTADFKGDTFLAEFDSVVQAAECAVEIQHIVKAKNNVRPEFRRMEFRIGINLGDVIVEEDRIYGDGVNIAARLEGLARPGGICISGSAYEQIRSKLSLGYEDIGEHTVKNISWPVRVYRIPIESPVRAEPLGENVTHSSGKPSIAVLPFDNLSSDPEQGNFADGIAVDLTADLSKISGLVVKANNSTFQYKGQPLDIKRIGRELRVEYVLGGSVRKAGNRVRMTAQLINVSSNNQIWAERYEGNLGDVFGLQDEITQAILNQLRVRLTQQEQEQIVSVDTENMDAHDAYIKGQQHYMLGTDDDWVKAIQYCQKAVRIDPDYINAHTFLAGTYLFGRPAHQELLCLTAYQMTRMGGEHLRLAMREPSAGGHHLVAFFFMQPHLMREAFVELEKGMAIEPNHAYIHSHFSRLLSWEGRSDEAISYGERAMDLDPFNLRLHSNTLANIGLAYFVQGRLDMAAVTLDRAMKQSPDDQLPRVYLAAAYACLNDLEKARMTLRSHEQKTGATFVLASFLYHLPFQDPQTQKQFADGLIRAGAVGESGKYHKLYQVNRLDGRNIQDTIFGKTITGVHAGKQWRLSISEEGDANQEGLNPDAEENGRAYIVADTLRIRWDDTPDDTEDVYPIMTNPDGTADTLNEYFAASFWPKFRTFSVDG